MNGTCLRQPQLKELCFPQITVRLDPWTQLATLHATLHAKAYLCQHLKLFSTNRSSSIKSARLDGKLHTI